MCAFLLLPQVRHMHHPPRLHGVTHTKGRDSHAVITYREIYWYLKF